MRKTITTMLAIKGIFDGKNFIPLEKLPTNKKFKVVITFLEEIEEESEVRNAYSQTDSFSFWSDSKEDIYSDFAKKKKVKK